MFGQVKESESNQDQDMYYNWLDIKDQENIVVRNRG